MYDNKFIAVTLTNQTPAIIAISRIVCVIECISKGPHGDEVKACRIYMESANAPKYAEVTQIIDEIARLIGIYDEVG